MTMNSMTIAYVSVTRIFPGPSYYSVKCDLSSNIFLSSLLSRTYLLPYREKDMMRILP